MFPKQTISAYETAKFKIGHALQARCTYVEDNGYNAARRVEQLFCIGVVLALNRVPTPGRGQ